MKVVVLVKATKNSEANMPPSEKLLADMMAFNEKLVKAGVMVAGEGLHPSSKGKRLKVGGGKRTVIDGPFAETKELVAGFWIWEVKSMDEAMKWLEQCPDPMPGEESILEVRPVHTAEDFAEADPSGKMRKKDEELRKKIASKEKRR